MDRAQRVTGNAPQILGSILVAASVRFALVALVRFDLDSSDLGLTIGFMKTVE